jgi:hypothetical protein
LHGSYTRHKAIDMCKSLLVRANLPFPYQVFYCSNDCQRLFKGSILDQSGTSNIDAVLRAAYTTTAKTWQRLYRIPYSTCGCYGVPEIEQRAPKSSSFKEKLKSKIAGRTTGEVDPAWDSFMAQVSVNEREASHPSSLEFNHR